MTGLAPGLRRLVVDDLPALFALEQVAQPLGWSEEALLVELVHDDAVVVGVDDEDDGLVASVVVRQIVDEVWILNIATHPVHRRRGHADRLLTAARTLQPNTATVTTSMWLEVREGNVAARGLYERHGFVVVGRRPGYYPGLDGGPREAAILMRRSLP